LPERSLSSKLAIPSALNRLTHFEPEAALVYPTLNPESCIPGMEVWIFVHRFNKLRPLDDS
jgi:hypothetical protein